MDVGTIDKIVHNIPRESHAKKWEFLEQVKAPILNF
jgi:hypothetical protein